MSSRMKTKKAKVSTTKVVETPNELNVSSVIPVVEAEVVNEIQQTAQPVITEKAPRVLLEVLVHGVETDKAIIKKMMDNIQAQMFKTKRGKYARVLWYIDKGEKTAEEKKEWLIEHANSKYYIFAPESNTVKPDFVKNVLIAIKKLEDAIDGMKGLKVILNKNKNESTKETTVEIDTARKTEMKIVK